MRFLVDAHIPAALCAQLASAGHDCVHTSQLVAGNRTRDHVINDGSVRDQQTVITKDTDFFYSHLLQGRPYKLVLVRTGNISTRDLKQLFAAHLTEILEALKTGTIVELHRGRVSVPNSLA